MLSVSIVTPSLNQGRFIEATIRSVLDQDYPAREYLVQDGGSTDATLSILKRYENENRLRWVSGPDAGQADAVNRGILASTGQVIGWLNSDDLYLPGALRSVCAFLDDHPSVDVVYGRAEIVDEDGAPAGEYRTQAWDPARLRDTCFLCQPAVFFRRRVVERYGLLDARLEYCMDYEYWLRLSAAGARFAYLPTHLAATRLYPTNKTRGSRLAVHAELNAMLRERLGRVPDRWLANHAHTLAELRGLSYTASPLRWSVVTALLYWSLSLRWNGRVSPGLALLSARRFVSGTAAAAGLWRPRSAAAHT